MERKEKTYYKIFFYVIMLGGLVLLGIGNYLSEGMYLREVLYIDAADSGMDFFNSTVMVAGRTPYSVGNSSYPPLASMLFYFFFHCMPETLQMKYYGVTLRSSEQDIRLNQELMVPYMIFMVLSFSVVAILLYRQKKGNDLEKSLFTLAMLTSSGMISVLDRGNCTVLALIFSMIFLFGYESDNKIIKEFSLIALAIAAGIKIYPAILGVLLLRDKHYKEALRAIVYGVVFFFGPFLFFERFTGVRVLFSNLLGLSGGEAIQIGRLNMTSAIYSWFLILGKENAGLMAFLNGAIYVELILVLILSLFVKEKWKAVSMLMLAIVSYSGVSCTYMLVMMIVPMLMFLDKEGKYSKLDVVYGILMICMLQTYPLPSSEYLRTLGGEMRFTTTAFVQQQAVFVMIFMLTIETVIGIVKSPKENLHNQYLQRH